MLDINVLLDVFIMRQPHYLASAQILSRVADQKLTGIVSAHGLTTLYYLARKQADRLTAEKAVDHVIAHCQIASLDNIGWRKARNLPLCDFEDAVIACLAMDIGCEYIISRNASHFAGSTVPAVSPVDFLCRH